MASKNPPVLHSRPETRAERTTAFAMTLIAKETTIRDAKTQRLRAARLEQEAARPKPAAATPPSKRKASPKKRTAS